jgi:tetratricopeptide (TPR) repeat protein
MAENNTSNAQVTKKPSTKALNFIINGCITLIFFLCPLFFTGFVAQGIGFEKMILFYFLVLLGTVAWVTKGVISGELNLKRTPLDFPIIAVILVYVVSTILSINTKDSIIGSYGDSAKSLVGIVIFTLFYYLVVNNVDLNKIKRLFWALIASSSLVIIFSILQLLNVFLLPMEFTKTPSFNPIGSLSSLTMFIVAMLPFLIIGVTQIKEISPKTKNALAIFFKVIIGIMVLAGFTVLAFLNGFTFWPAAIVGIVIVLMFFLSKIISVSSNNLVIPLSAFLLVIIFLVLGNYNVINLNLPTEVSLSKGASWDIARESIKKDPILGSGPSTFYHSFSLYKGADFNSSPLWNVRFDRASGLFFELLANVGVLGTLAVVVIILITLSMIFLSLIKAKDKEIASVLLASFSSYIIIIIFSLLFSLNNSMILISMIVAIFATSISIIVYPEKFKSLKLSFKSSPKYALALAAIFLTVSAGVVVLFTMGLKMYLADVYARKAMMEENVEERIVKLDKAIGLFPYQDSYYMDLANLYMAIANREVSENKDQVVIENSLNRAIEIGKRGLDLNSKRASNNESLALIYENASFYTRGALEWSENLYKKLIELEPDNPVPHLRLGLISMARANAEEDEGEKKFYMEEAVKKYDEAIAKKSDLASAFYGKAVVNEQLGDIDNAIEELKRAVISTQDNVDYRFELGRLYFNRGVSQSNISQSALEEIIANEEETDEEELSVESTQSGEASGRNEDLTMAEQVFLSILQIMPNHANALYSLALLYQNIDETENAKAAVGALLNLIEDEETEEAIKKQFPGLY